MRINVIKERANDKFDPFTVFNDLIKNGKKQKFKGMVRFGKFGKQNRCMASKKEEKSEREIKSKRDGEYQTLFSSILGKNKRIKLSIHEYAATAETRPFTPLLTNPLSTSTSQTTQASRSKVQKYPVLETI